MTDFKRRALLVLSCISAVAFVWMITEIEKSKRCLASKSVSFFTLQETANSKKLPLPICGLPVGDPDVFDGVDNIQEIKEALINFDYLVTAMSGEVNSQVRVNVVNHSPYRIDVSENEIEIGSELVQTKGWLLKALTTSWLLKSNKSIEGNPVMLEVFSDVLVAAQTGGLSIQQPMSGKVAKFAEIGEDERKSLSQMEICDSAWLPMSQVGFCRSLIKVKNEKELEPSVGDAVKRMASVPSVYSIRSYLGSSLWHLYKGKDLVDRVSTLKQMFEKFSKINFSDVDVPIASEKWPEFADKQKKSLF